MTVVFFLLQLMDRLRSACDGLEMVRRHVRAHTAGVRSKTGSATPVTPLSPAVLRSALCDALGITAALDTTEAAAAAALLESPSFLAALQLDAGCVSHLHGVVEFDTGSSSGSAASRIYTLETLHAAAALSRLRMALTGTVLGRRGTHTAALDQLVRDEMNDHALLPPPLAQNRVLDTAREGYFIPERIVGLLPAPGKSIAFHASHAIRRNDYIVAPHLVLVTPRAHIDATTKVDATAPPLHRDTVQFRDLYTRVLLRHLWALPTRRPTTSRNTDEDMECTDPLLPSLFSAYGFHHPAPSTATVSILAGAAPASCGVAPISDDAANVFPALQTQLQSTEGEAVPDLNSGSESVAAADVAGHDETDGPATIPIPLSNPRPSWLEESRDILFLGTSHVPAPCRTTSLADHTATAGLGRGDEHPAWDMATRQQILHQFIFKMDVPPPPCSSISLDSGPSHIKNTEIIIKSGRQKEEEHETDDIGTGTGNHAAESLGHQGGVAPEERSEVKITPQAAVVVMKDEALQQATMMDESLRDQEARPIEHPLVEPAIKGMEGLWNQEPSSSSPPPRATASTADTSGLCPDNTNTGDSTTASTRDGIPTAATAAGPSRAMVDQRRRSKHRTTDSSGTTKHHPGVPSTSTRPHSSGSTHRSGTQHGSSSVHRGKRPSPTCPPSQPTTVPVGSLCPAPPPPSTTLAGYLLNGPTPAPPAHLAGQQSPFGMTTVGNPADPVAAAAAAVFSSYRNPWGAGTPGAAGGPAMLPRHHHPFPFPSYDATAYAAAAAAAATHPCAPPPYHHHHHPFGTTGPPPPGSILPAAAAAAAAEMGLRAAMFSPFPPPAPPTAHASPVRAHHRLLHHASSVYPGASSTTTATAGPSVGLASHHHHNTTVPGLALRLFPQPTPPTSSAYFTGTPFQPPPLTTAPPAAAPADHHAPVTATTTTVAGDPISNNPRAYETGSIRGSPGGPPPGAT